MQLKNQFSWSIFQLHPDLSVCSMDCVHLSQKFLILWSGSGC